MVRLWVMLTVALMINDHQQIGTKTIDTSRNILVTGGAGYIGSHTVYALIDAGFKVVVLDDLSTGHTKLLPPDVPLIVGNVDDVATVSALLRDHNIIDVLHFAGSTIVPESFTNPSKYFHNNTDATRVLVECCLGADVQNFIFSSTAAVYAEPDQALVTEDAALSPPSPYGESKLRAEDAIRELTADTEMQFGILRYFNVAGADPAGRTGQITENATHLIKSACEAALGLRDTFVIYGHDYDTPDGTCIRDFIHVSDLADAHIAMLKYLNDGSGSTTLNCGYGRGFSVKQVADTIRSEIGKGYNVEIGPRRSGDAVRVVADTAKIREMLNWTPRRDDLSEIIRTTLAWERKHQAEINGEQ